ncbi:hypothetical protein J3458_005848 [Metarhizium acridum]|uniref:uncharacterized protein n=1 Tax=Metarhizium acridum TaxID=92637 RepID=UPI001C6C208F|nr:hypothetical protein J3458_005848 [Metarhizium acridum]
MLGCWYGGTAPCPSSIQLDHLTFPALGAPYRPRIRAQRRPVAACSPPNVSHLVIRHGMAAPPCLMSTFSTLLALTSPQQSTTLQLSSSPVPLPPILPRKIPPACRRFLSPVSRARTTTHLVPFPRLKKANGRGCSLGGIRSLRVGAFRCVPRSIRQSLSTGIGSNDSSDSSDSSAVLSIIKQRHSLPLYSCSKSKRRPAAPLNLARPGRPVISKQPRQFLDTHNAQLPPLGEGDFEPCQVGRDPGLAPQYPPRVRLRVLIDYLAAPCAVVPNTNVRQRG